MSKKSSQPKALPKRKLEELEESKLEVSEKKVRKLQKQKTSLIQEAQALQQKVEELQQQLEQASKAQVEKSKIQTFLHSILEIDLSDDVLVDITFNEDDANNLIVLGRPPVILLLQICNRTTQFIFSICLFTANY